MREFFSAERDCVFQKNLVKYYGIINKYLGVAQLGRVPEWGSGGRRFKSSHPDQKRSS